MLDVHRGDGTYVRGYASNGLFDAQFFRIIAMGTRLPELIQLRHILETGIMNAALGRVTDQDVEKLQETENHLQKAVEEGASIHCANGWEEGRVWILKK